MTDAVLMDLFDLVTFSALGTFVRWFVLFVGICFVYYVVYSLRRLRASVHHIANRLQVVLGQEELKAHVDAAYDDPRPRSPARR